jgi:hypothetical protein
MDDRMARAKDANPVNGEEKCELKETKTSEKKSWIHL